MAASVAALVIAGSVAPDAASAGTLTSATFTTLGTGYAATNAQNTRYDYGFTTATSSTLSSVRATVPSGTNSYGTRYLSIANTLAGNVASTPDSAATSPTTLMDARVKISTAEWPTSGQHELIDKWIDTAPGGSFLFRDTAGNISISWSYDGTPGNTKSFSWSRPAWGATVWLRSTVDSTGSTSNVTAYWSSDGTNWTSLGSFNTGASAYPIYDSTTPLRIGGRVDQIETYPGKIYFASVAQSINGTTSSPTSCTTAGVTACFNPADASQTQAAAGSWTSSSAQAETWSINRNGSYLPADIASDLTVTSITGLPSTGTASYRMIDGAALYVFSSAASIGLGVNCTLSLTGFTNTATAGSYSSIITTYDNSATPVAVDSATTATLAFADMGAQSNTYVQVDPTFALVVANQATACNGESNFVSSGGTATSIALAHETAGGNVSAGQALSVVGNSGGGFAVYVRGTQSVKNLRSAAYNWTDTSGTYASPASLSGEAFGYTYKDSTTSSSVTNPASAKFVALDTTNRAVLGSASSASGSGCVSFDAQSAAATPAGSYTATVIYTAVPTY